MITIALPVHACRITWLAMESLCRQVTVEPWELIVYEDSDIYQGGAAFYLSYMDRLQEVGCQRIDYIYTKKRIPLSQKWKEIAQAASPDSLGLILQASDCYSEPLRINTAVAAFRNGFGWIQSPKGVFYNIKTQDTMLYNNPKTGTALNMAIALKHALNLDDTERWSGVDWWLYDSLPDYAEVFFDESSNWMNGVDTDGHNRISTERKLYYRNPKPPFYKTDLRISQLVPHDIFERLLEL